MKKNRFQSSLIALSALTLLPLQYGQAAPKPVPQITHTVNPEILALLKSNDSQFTPELRTAFLAHAKKQVLEKLSSQGKSVDPKLLTWIDSDTQAADAVYGSVYPADPNILLNLHTLWSEIGPETKTTYKQLCLAAAVARRGVGVDSLASFGKWGHLYKLAREAKAAGKDPATVLAKSANKSNDLLPKSENDKVAYQAVASYLQAQELTPRQAFEDKEKLTEVAKILQRNNCTIKANKCLKGILIIDGKRPKERSATLSVSEYFKFLVKINKIPAPDLPLDEGQQWPIFPVTTAPWPLLMPLSHSIPQDEADYIWSKFLGKQDGKRIHTYGPYRKGAAAQNPTYDSREWHWKAWPSLIKEGGVCGTMSTIAMWTYTTLGRPVLKAGQPGHSCLVTYNVTADGQFIGSVGQSVTAGPDGTGTSWLFQDGASWKCRGAGANAVHHYGLALSMNRGVDNYMKSRMALHVYRMMSTSQKRTLGRQLLNNCLQKNPYNTELWYTLAKDAESVDIILGTIQKSKKLIRSDAEAEAAQDGDASAAIEGAEKNQGRNAQSTAKTKATYLKLINEAIIANALAEPKKFDSSDQIKALEYLTQQTTPSKEIILAKDRFYLAVNGPQKLATLMQNDVSEFLTSPPKGRKAIGRSQGLLKKRIAQLATIGMATKDYQLCLKSMIDDFPESKASYKKKGVKKLNPLFEECFKALYKSYSRKPRNHAGRKQLDQLKKSLLQ